MQPSSNPLVMKAIVQFEKLADVIDRALATRYVAVGMTPASSSTEPLVRSFCVVSPFCSDCPPDPVCDEDGVACECQPGMNGYSCGVSHDFNPYHFMAC